MVQLLYFIITQLPILGLVYQKAFEKPLTTEKENELLLKMQQGDQDAREKLICHNLRLVAHIVKKYENYLDDKEDLISIGVIGLTKAIDSYTINKKTKLGTYAAKCITNEILMHLRMNKKRNLDISLNDPVNLDIDGEQLTLIDIISAPIDLPIENLSHQEDLEYLRSILKVLDETELEIIEWRYGLNHKETLTQKEIAKMFHISRSYVSRIEKKALLKLYREFRKIN